MTVTAVDPLLGKSFGNVRLTSRLGAGAMGVVYRGFHDRFDREVAVKLLVSQRGDKPSYRERFLREGKAAAKVHHDHVVQVLDAGQQDNIAYLVMELVNGLSLGSLLDEAKLLAPEVVQRLGVGIALGLAAIHAQGIVHRDIKPDNILVGADKKAKIADLGLAKQIDEPELNRLTGTGVVVGTPLYVAPESIRDPQSIDGKADIYGLGATMYHMLTGRPPFEGNTPFEVMHGHLDGIPVPIRQLRPEVPVPLADLVEQCLAKLPAQRPTAMELADLLSQGGRRRARRGLGLTIALATLALLAVAGGVAWLGQTRATALTPPPSSGAGSGAASGVVRIAALGPVRMRIDGGAWGVPPDAGVTVASGKHRIEVESDQPGPLRRGALEIDVVGGATAEANVPLAPVRTVQEVRITVPGSGMIFADGEAYAWRESQLPLLFAGRYAIARWDGTKWTNGEVRVDDTGRASEPSWQPSERPLRDAYWRSRDDKGRPLPPHHVVCWWEAEQARNASKLVLPGVGWMAQGNHPEQPPESLSNELVKACVQLFARYGAVLPERDQALTIAKMLNGAVYCADGGSIAKVGGLDGAAAQLVLVPAADE